MSQPMKGRRSRVSSLDEDSECCVSCKKKIGVKQDAVECQWCKHWEHRVCSKITDNEYKLLNSISVNIMFVCTSCCSKVPVALSLFDNGDRMDKKFEAMYSKFTKELELLSSSIRDNYNSMQENVSTLSTKVKDQYSQNVDLQEKLNHSKVLAAAVEQGDPVQVRAQLNIDSATKIVDEYNDRERRKCNVIVYNAPQSMAKDLSTQKKDDVSFVNVLCEKLAIPLVEIRDVTRLGSKSSSKNGLLRVKCCDLLQRQQLLMNARKLRKFEEFKNVYVNPDLTRAERVAQKELRQELARRKADGEKDIYIHRGLIVHKSNAVQHKSGIVSSPSPAVQQSSSQARSSSPAIQQDS